MGLSVIRQLLAPSVTRMVSRRRARERQLAKGRERVIAEAVRLNVAAALVLALFVGWFNGPAATAILVLIAIPAGYWAGRVRGRWQWDWLNSWDD